MKRFNKLPLVVFAVSLVCTFPISGLAQSTGIYSQKAVVHPVSGKNGMVASQEARATKIGLEILKRGGNAIDAAVAVSFALAVTLPRAGNIAGGGFMLIHLGQSGETIAIDYREMAPGLSSFDMFLKNGEVDKKLSQSSHRSVGVPGTIACLTYILENYGTLSLSEVIAPAIQLAEEGIIVTKDIEHTLTKGRSRLQRWEETKKTYYKPDGSVYRVGERMKFKDLAETLRILSRHGAKAFYEGTIADKIVNEMSRHGGLITKEDLKNYKLVVRQPVRGHYRGYEVLGMPPPSSGGIHIIQMLNLLEEFPLAEWGPGVETLHVVAESMRLAFADRSRYLGDSDWWNVPVKGLTSKEYASRLRSKINRTHATPSDQVLPGNVDPYESDETTHFSIMDHQGNVVSNTTTLNFSFGSGIVVPGTGILLNNEMDNFSSKPGVPNAYGLLGGEANAIQPTKRPLSSMSPMILFKDKKPFLATGSPGGPRLINAVLQVILNVIDHGMNIAEATAQRRIHQQWMPDQLRVEKGFNPDTLRLLKEKGHTIVVKNAMGSTQSVLKSDEGFEGASDTRRPGALTLGY